MPVTKKKSKYFKTNSDKDRAVAVYASTGSFTKSSALTGIHENTLRYWAKQDWFAEAVLRANQADSEEIKSTLTTIAKKATSELEDRLTYGDEVLDKDGNLIRKKIGGKDLAVITGITVQRRKELMEVPNQISNQSTEEKLKSLMEQFIRFALAKEINAKDSRTTGESTTSEGEIEVLSLCDSDEPVTESGGPEEGNPTTYIEGSAERVDESSSESEGQSS